MSFRKFEKVIHICSGAFVVALCERHKVAALCECHKGDNMYTHIGNGMIVKNKDVIGVFDWKTIQESKQNKRIQYQLQQKKLTGKAVIVKEIENGEATELVSDISVATLKKRLEKGIVAE